MSDDRTREELLKELAELEAMNENLRGQISDGEDRIDDLESQLEARNDPYDACESFLSELDRPCGSRKFIIPDNSRVHDAIRAMADAIGRNA